MAFSFGKNKKEEKRDIHLSSGKPVVRDIIVKKSSLSEKPVQKQEKEPPRPPPKKEKKKFKAPKLSINYPKGFEKVKTPKMPSLSRLKIILAGVFVLVVVLLAVQWLSYVQVNVVPKQEIKEINTSFEVLNSGGDLTLETALLEKTAEQEQKTTGLKEIRDKAHGEIVIYNSYSSQPQILVRNTRFETPDGKIYRIPENITVPGANVVEGEIKSSSITVEVFADEPGEDYNIGLTDFTIPGFKGSLKFEKFYARSKTPMTGGFVGVAPIVLREDADALLNDTREKLEKALIDEIANQTPEGLFVPSGASRIRLTQEQIIPEVGERAQTVRISLTGSYDAMLVKKDDVKSAIVSKYYGEQMVQTVGIANFDELDIVAKNVDFENSSLTLVVQGNAHFVWLFDENSLKEKLVLASRKERLAVFGEFSAIERADMKFVPYWWIFFPNKAEKLDINIILNAS